MLTGQNSMHCQNWQNFSQLTDLIVHPQISFCLGLCRHYCHLTHCHLCKQYMKKKNSLFISQLHKLNIVTILFFCKNKDQGATLKFLPCFYYIWPGSVTTNFNIVSRFTLCNCALGFTFKTCKISLIIPSFKSCTYKQEQRCMPPTIIGT